MGHFKGQKEEELTDAIKKIIKQLNSRKVNWDFSDTPFQDVITYIRTQDQINIVVDPKVIRNFDLDGIRITLHLERVKLKDALKILFEFYNLTSIYF